MWPAELDTCPGDGIKRRIDRAVLFRIAERAASDATDPWAAAQLHAGIVFWGAPPGISMRRAVRPFVDPAAPQRLSEALKIVRGEGPESAYKVLSRAGRLRVDGLGPSYFTKFLYFGGYGAKRYMPQPLIMDDNVVRALNEITELPWEASSRDYMCYLEVAADWASELEIDADVIKRRPFQIGE